MFKQIIIIRNDLKMSEGKKCVQAAHASLGAYKKSDKKMTRKWELEGQKKVVLEVDSRKKILDLYKKSKKEKIPCFLVEDAGLTELKPGTITALGIGPEREETLDKITGNLKLL
jgi:PTH2 family peptidyl-tRNA hydrolase